MDNTDWLGRGQNLRARSVTRGQRRGVLGKGSINLPQTVFEGPLASRPGNVELELSNEVTSDIN